MYVTIVVTGFVALYIFMLAAVTGYEIISKVPAILHTPLMSGSNFVHGIVVVWRNVCTSEAHATRSPEQVIGFFGVLLGAGNAAGGYVVTERMLEMFKRATRERLEEDFMNLNLIIDASAFAAALLFILGLKRMSSPVTARSGIMVAGNRHVGCRGRKVSSMFLMSRAMQDPI